MFFWLEMGFFSNKSALLLKVLKGLARLWWLKAFRLVSLNLSILYFQKPAQDSLFSYFWNQFSNLCYTYFKCTAIPHRAITGPEQGFPCVVFLHREKPVFIAGFLVDENRFFPVGNTSYQLNISWPFLSSKSDFPVFKTLERHLFSLSDFTKSGCSATADYEKCNFGKEIVEIRHG